MYIIYAIIDRQQNSEIAIHKTESEDVAKELVSVLYRKHPPVDIEDCLAGFRYNQKDLSPSDLIVITEQLANPENDQIKQFTTDAQSYESEIKRLLGAKTTHSEDFTSVLWYGKHYKFSEPQAEIIKILWEDWKNKGPGITRKEIISNYEIKESFQIEKTFKHTQKGKGDFQHEAFGSMIVIQNRRCYLMPRKQS